MRNHQRWSKNTESQEKHGLYLDIFSPRKLLGCYVNLLNFYPEAWQLHISNDMGSVLCAEMVSIKPEEYFFDLHFSDNE